jgi:hypothetical protein
MSNKAILTCDLVGFSKLNSKTRLSLIDRVKVLIGTLSSETQAEYIIYRGDSLQGILHRSWEALRHAIRLKAYIKSYRIDKGTRSTQADIRISIGIGTIDYLGETLLDSDGPAFRYSGRTLDTMKKGGRSLKLTTPNDPTNKKWDLILTLLEEIMDQWTISSAEVVWRLLSGMDDKGIANDLNISHPAVSLRKKHAGWDAIEQTILYFEDDFTQVRGNGSIS